MANSLIIGKTKNKIIKEFIKDIDIIQAIGDEEITSLAGAEKLVNKCIFTYNQNPFTLNTVKTFITIQVHIPNSYLRNNTFVKPTIEIWIVSHEQHMVIDNRLNGRKDIGLGELKLISNIEGAFQKDYLYRKMVFEGTDLNNSLCAIE